MENDDVDEATADVTLLPVASVRQWSEVASVVRKRLDAYWLVDTDGCQLLEARTPDNSAAAIRWLSKKHGAPIRLDSSPGYFVQARWHNGIQAAFNGFAWGPGLMAVQEDGLRALVWALRRLGFGFPGLAEAAASLSPEYQGDLIAAIAGGELARSFARPHVERLRLHGAAMGKVLCELCAHPIPSAGHEAAMNADKTAFVDYRAPTAAHSVPICFRCYGAHAPIRVFCRHAIYGK